MRSPSRCTHGFWGLPFAAGLVLGGAGLLGSGCGETAERSLTLVSPVLEPCNKSRDPSCTDTFFGCADLKAEQLTFSVGLFDKESTTVACPPELSSGSATVKIRYRPSHRGPEDLTMVITGVRTDLDPPRVLGYLLPSRSRRELRADRILAVEKVGQDDST